MSGPKVDIVKLREQERKKLEAARQLRKSLADKLLTQIQRVQSELFNLDSDQGKKIQMVQKECLEHLEKLLAEVQAGNETLDCESVLREMEYRVSECDNQVRPYLEQIGQLNKNAEESERLEKQKQQLSQMTRKKIQVILSASDPKQQAGTKEITQDTVFEQVQAFVQEIKSFVAQNGITVSKKNSILQLHRELMELSKSDIEVRKKSRKISNLFDDYEQIKILAEKELAMMKFAYEKYLRECFELAGGVRAFEEFHSVEEIEEVIKLGQTQASEQVSKEYIKRQIDEVMSKHGYDIIRSDQLKEAPADGQVLYGVNDQTAINVFVSEDDQVTMRVVGIGFNEGISAQENEDLFQQQCAFCSLHPQITAELKMRGVILETRKHLPPDRKYNKKIQTKNKQLTQNTSRAKKELKRTEQKVMRKE